MPDISSRVRLRSEKAIADELGRVWGFEVSWRSIARWRALRKDPLPFEEIQLGDSRPIIACDPDKLRAWALRHVRSRSQRAA